MPGTVNHASTIATFYRALNLAFNKFLSLCAVKILSEAIWFKQSDNIWHASCRDCYVWSDLSDFGFLLFIG